MATVLLGLLLLTVLPGAAAAAAPRGGNPTLTLSPASGPVGTLTSVAGSGFPRSTAATVTLAGSTVEVRTDRRGTLKTRLTVPLGVSGSVPVTATAGSVVASAPFTVVVPAPSPPAPAAGLRFGVTTPGGPRAEAELEEVTRLAGEAPSLVMWYRGFGQELDPAELDAVRARGAQPMITWEPYDWTAGPEQPEYALSRITSGQFDPYLHRWADGLRRHGQPVMLRFAHEMNGDWYPWSEARNGNRPGDYVAAWRHVHDLFAAAGVTNVSWVWSPNVSYPGSLPLAGLYPGHDYVDVVALDGYNWGTGFPFSAWQSPAQVFDPSMAELRLLAPGKPIVIAETASNESGGSKAGWVRDLFAWMAAQPDLQAFVWFHHDKETDWRFSSSTTSSAAFAEGLAGRRR